MSEHPIIPARTPLSELAPNETAQDLKLYGWARDEYDDRAFRLVHDVCHGRVPTPEHLELAIIQDLNHGIFDGYTRDMELDEESVERIVRDCYDWACKVRPLISDISQTDKDEIFDAITLKIEEDAEKYLELYPLGHFSCSDETDWIKFGMFTNEAMLKEKFEMFDRHLLAAAIDLRRLKDIIEEAYDKVNRERSNSRKKANY